MDWEPNLAGAVSIRTVWTNSPDTGMLPKCCNSTADLKMKIYRVAGETAVEHAKLMDGAAGVSLYEAYGAAADGDFERVDAVLETIGQHKGPKWTAETKTGIYSMAGRDG